MRYSPAYGIARLFSPIMRMGKKYGAEWWILVFGALIISGVVLSTILTLFLVPLAYSLLAPFTKASNRIEREIEALEQKLAN